VASICSILQIGITRTSFFASFLRGSLHHSPKSRFYLKKFVAKSFAAIGAKRLNTVSTNCSNMESQDSIPEFVESHQQVEYINTKVGYMRVKPFNNCSLFGQIHRSDDINLGNIYTDNGHLIVGFDILE